MGRLSKTLTGVWQRVLPESGRRALYLWRRGWHPWPLFKYVLALAVDGELRNKARRLRKLRGKYRGNRCFIMGNGPSINKTDLSLLQDEFVWGLNRCYLLFDRISWRPSFFVAVDRRVVPDIAGEINRVIGALPKTLFFFPSRFRSEWILRSDRNVYWYSEKPQDRNDLPFGMFSRDASSWVSTASTVSVAGLQLAVYLGFSPIYLIGCDTSYSIPDSVLKEGDNPKHLVSTRDDDPNHFHPGYFGKGRKWHDPQVERMFFHYEQAKQVCNALGVQVYNATIGGALEVFPRVDYRTLFSKP